MAQLVIRQLDDDLMQKLQARARGNGRSVEEEAREIIMDALRSDDEDTRVR
jgi:plasmid stability protein